MIPEDLIIDEAEFRVARMKLAAEKHAVQEQITEINARCTTRLPSQEYHKIQRRRAELVKLMRRIELEISELKGKQAATITSIELEKRKQLDVRELIAIRDRWHDFSMDPKNHQKAREVAWKVAQELREILKPFFAPEASR